MTSIDTTGEGTKTGVAGDIGGVPLRPKFQHAMDPSFAEESFFDRWNEIREETPIFVSNFQGAAYRDAKLWYFVRHRESGCTRDREGGRHGLACGPYAGETQ